MLEKYIKDYVFDKTAEVVYLMLDDAITIRHVTKKGSITLASFWVNVLQHPMNYPPKLNRYSKQYDRVTGGDRLQVKADDISLTVHMATGALVLEGKYVYDWFTTKFGRLLDHYDMDFAKSWTFVPTGSAVIPSANDGTGKLNDPNTGMCYVGLCVVTFRDYI